MFNSVTHGKAVIPLKVVPLNQGPLSNEVLSPMDKEFLGFHTITSSFHLISSPHLPWPQCGDAGLRHGEEGTGGQQHRQQHALLAHHLGHLRQRGGSSLPGGQQPGGQRLQGRGGGGGGERAWLDGWR